MNKFIIAILCFLSGCSNQASTVFVCPHTYDWTLPQIKQLGQEDEKLPQDSMLHRSLTEDADLRAQIHSNPNCGE